MPGRGAQGAGARWGKRFGGLPDFCAAASGCTARGFCALGCAGFWGFAIWVTCRYGRLAPQPQGRRGQDDRKIGPIPAQRWAGRSISACRARIEGSFGMEHSVMALVLCITTGGDFADGCHPPGAYAAAGVEAVREGAPISLRRGAADVALGCKRWRRASARCPIWRFRAIGRGRGGAGSACRRYR